MVFFCQLNQAEAKKKKEKDLTPTMRKSLKIDARGHAVIDEQYENLLPDGEVPEDKVIQEETSKSEEAYQQIIDELFSEQQPQETTLQEETPEEEEIIPASETTPENQIETPEEKQGFISSFKEKIQKSKEERKKKKLPRQA